MPTNWETLWPRLDKMIQEYSSQWDSGTQLDVFYSLAVLKQLKPTELPSLLNDIFIQKVLGISFWIVNSKFSTSEVNLWRLRLSWLWKCRWSWRARRHLQHPVCHWHSVMEALSNFVPGKMYLRQNEQTALGLNIRSECILDSKCVAVPLSNHDQGQPLPADCARYAIISFKSRLFIPLSSF